MQTGKTSSLGVTWLSVILNVLLGVVKCAVGVLFHSKALVADGFHSLMDLSSDLVTLFGLKMASIPEDRGHLYGHHKFTSLSSLLISILLMAFCVGLCWGSILGLIGEAQTLPEWPVLVMAGVSVFIKEGLYWRTMAVARKEKSRLLEANAWHHRVDAVSSLLVFLAIGVIFWLGEGYYWLDAGLGIGLSVYLAWGSARLFLQSCNDLLDAAPEVEMINDLREHILPVHGVEGYHNFRVRRVGDLFEIDVHVQVNAEMTVDAGHLVASEVKQVIMAQHKDVLNVLVHIEPASEKHLREKGISELG